MKARLTLEDGTEINVTVDESELKKETSKRWKPERGERYWFITNTGYVQDNRYKNIMFDKWHYSQRNMFRTEEEATQHLAYLKARAAILDHADEVNEGWEPDWSNPGEMKYRIFYDHEDGRLFKGYVNLIQQTHTTYYKSKEAAEDAINKVGDKYLTVLGVEK